MTTSPIYSNNLQNSANAVPDNAESQTLKVAREFESIFVSYLMKSMRSTVFDGELMEKGVGEKIYTELLDDEYAKMIARSGSLGLAERIVEQIESIEGAGSGMLKALRGIGSRDRQYGAPYASGERTAPSFTGLLGRITAWTPLIDKASAEYNVDRHLISAVIAQESGGNPYAVSRAGAKGLMQLMDSTAQTVGVSRVFNPHDNIMGGVKYLEQLLRDCGNNEKLALASYNAGPAAVKKYGGIPPYKETEQYVVRVLDLKEKFKQHFETLQADNTSGE